MPRTKKNRLIHMAPNFGGFKPKGVQKKSNKEILINYDEYEALNLCDYELLTHVQASEIMNISRPTFTRIYQSVRRKIALAFIEGRTIKFEGGNIELANWYKCSKCEITFSINKSDSKVCPLCKNDTITVNN